MVLVIFGTQSHGYEVYNIISPNNNGGNLQETVTIDNQKNIAIVNIHAGSCSSTTIFDYKHGYIASQVLSRRACYILKMDHKAIPALDELKRYIYEKQVILQDPFPFPVPLPGKAGAYRGKKRAMKNMYSDKYLWVKYNPLQSLIMHIDWFLFGSPIRQLCSHVPLYKGEVVDKLYNVRADVCSRTGFLGIFGISICASVGA
ncbi:hypothetical protein GH733_009236 [Mirounga leonina]|nr:hypothetical protein GH733_009236 [Mirounga leonina]